MDFGNRGDAGGFAAETFHIFAGCSLLIGGSLMTFVTSNDKDGRDGDHYPALPRLGSRLGPPGHRPSDNPDNYIGSTYRGRSFGEIGPRDDRASLKLTSYRKGHEICLGCTVTPLLSNTNCKNHALEALGPCANFQVCAACIASFAKYLLGPRFVNSALTTLPASSTRTLTVILILP
jgi:hypothetical protein